MISRIWYTTFLVLVALPVRMSAQAHLAPPPHRGPAPLLYLRFLGPAGTQATFYQGSTRGRAFPLPVVVGVRPGYRYRLELGHFPGLPGISVFPSLDVLASLELPPRLSAVAYPAPVLITETDVERIAAGMLVTKVIYLEHPNKATPVATRPDQPIETDLPANADLLAEARERGRPVLVLRLGGRLLTPQDMAHESAPGTILLPGDRCLPYPARPPFLPPACDRLYDPFIGRRPPEEECLHDGGDQGVRAGLDWNGQIIGLEPEDTVAAYTDSHGRRRISCSNRVCLCVPRFVLLRQELQLVGHEMVVGLGGTRLTQIQEQVGLRLPSRQTMNRENLQRVEVKQRPSEAVGLEKVGRLLRIEVLEASDIVVGPLALLGTNHIEQLSVMQRTRLLRRLELTQILSEMRNLSGVEQTTLTAVVARVENAPEVIRATAEIREMKACCLEAPRCLPEKPLVLVKCADREAAQVGDEVTFTLRYTNGGSRALTDVAIADSLNPRLEYVPNSAQSDRNAVFTMQDNGAGSVILRWEITGRLQPGQSGVVRFKVRVR